MLPNKIFSQNTKGILENFNSKTSKLDDNSLSLLDSKTKKQEEISKLVLEKDLIPVDYCKYIENQSKKQNKINFFNEEVLYNAVQLRQWTDIFNGRKLFLAEGPDKIEGGRNTLNQYYQFLAFNKIDFIIAIGAPVENRRQKYTDYFRAPQSLAFTEIVEIMNSQFSIKIPECFHDDFKKTNFRFYQINQFNQNKLVMHVENWNDHGLDRFSLNDFRLLAFLALAMKTTLAHCSAGLGRAPSVLLIMMGLLSNIFNTYKAESVIDKFVDLVSIIRAERPQACIEQKQLLSIPFLIECLIRDKDLMQQLKAFDNTFQYPPIFSQDSIMQSVTQSHFGGTDNSKVEEKEEKKIITFEEESSDDDEQRSLRVSN